MGLKITTELYTDAGVSSEVYINIKSIEILNKDRLVVTLNNYLNQEARSSSYQDTITCRRLFRSIGILLITKESEIEESPESPSRQDDTEFNKLTSMPVHAYVYSKIKEKLIEGGLEVEDDL